LAYACGAEQTIRSELSLTQRNALLAALDSLLHTMNSGEITPIMLLTPEPERQPKDFSFLPIAQYGDAMETRVYPSLSALLDAFYGERDAVDRMKQKMSDFCRLVQSRIERMQRKLCAQREELLACRNRDQLRRTGDLLASNLHRVEKGMSSVTVEDYYSPDGAPVTIALEIRLTPSQNVQHYYKEYRRADTAEKMLIGLIAEGERELDYLDTVWDEMTRARSEAELGAIRAELAESGYLRAAPGAKRKQESKLKPLCYRSSDGFTILSGRNNVQNERLTLKDSRNSDLWFHAQKIAGAHTVVLTEGKTVPDRTLTEAAIIAAVNSRACHSSKVAIDYTPIKNVKKQPGGRPGMVIYTEYQTAVVDPDEALVQTLAVGE
ncbi:MAG: NFACT family protein, partial [Oscillospiraceae bacterium]